ncbi:Multidrug/Oligosaccharidyl-lipid/Polysaccharide (MOP) Flippase Superfamily [Achlya hypogyna]|uniref:Multidrug/Oligosaccharidyl-lipid/Polysaccharide (MOP) Flippase Superfamily n=1 Tax=Achlya hypogyna TaxID=1202772 RepID=A0A1V9YCW4_ACHHY|nr:Multidrug/Oligosaccharidyl-lipid/Polysaccharide (MOP) Flippase Superfamily [Achlya hypogyna]
MALILVTVLTVPAILYNCFVTSILQHTTDDTAVVSLGARFAGLLSLGIWPQLVYVCLRLYLQSTSIVMEKTVNGVLTIGIGVAANYLLIYTAGLGFDGSPLATTLAAWFDPMALYLCVFAYKHYRKQAWGGWKKAELTWAALSFVVAKIGSEAIAVNAVLSSIWTIVGGIYFDVGIAAAIGLAEDLGARRLNSAKSCARLGFTVLAIASLVVVTVLRFGQLAIVAIFTKDPRLVDGIVAVLPLYVAHAFLAAFEMGLFSLLIGMGQVPFGSGVTIFCLWGMQLPLAYYLGIHQAMSLKGVWMACLIASASKLVILIIRFNAINWLKMVTNAQAIGETEGGNGKASDTTYFDVDDENVDVVLDSVYVAESPKIARYVRCPFVLAELLAIIPPESLEASFRSYLALARTVPCNHLWPELRPAALPEASNHDDVDAYLALRPIVRLDTTSPPRFPWLRSRTNRLAMCIGIDVAALGYFPSMPVVELVLFLRTLTNLEAARRVIASFALLRTLELSWRTNGSEARVRPLLDSLLQMPLLEDVIVSCTGVDAPPMFFVDRLVAWITTRPANALSLRRLDWDDTACDAMVRAIRGCRTLRALHLDDTNAVAFALVQAPLPPTLSRLTLSRGFAIYGELLPAALAHSRLEWLEMDATDSSVLRDILLSWKSMPRLFHVRLSLNELSFETSVCLANVLEQLPRLEVLEITVSHEIAALPALGHCPRLLRVAIRGHVPIEAWRSFVPPPKLQIICGYRGAAEAPWLHGGMPLLAKGPATDDLFELRSELLAYVSLGLQVALANITRIALTTIDSAFLGHLGTESLAAASLATIWTQVALFSVWNLSSALITLCGQAFGARNYALMGVWFQMALLLVSALTVVVIIYYWFLDYILVGATDDAVIVDLGTRFARILSGAIWPTLAYACMRQYLQAMGIVAPTTAIGTISIFLAVGANSVLIYGVGDWPGLGFDGSAVATVLASWFQPAALFLYAFVYKQYYKRAWGGWHLSAYTKERWVTFLRMAIPLALIDGFTTLANSCMSLIAAYMGAEVLASNAILLTFWGLLWALFWGFGCATQVKVANHLGAGHPKAAKAASRLGFATIVVVVGVVVVAMGAGHNVILRIYTDDTTLIAHCVDVLPLFVLGFSLDALEITITAILNGMGQMPFVSSVVFFGMWVVQLPVSYLLAIHFGYGFRGLWGGICVTAGFKLSVLSVKYLLVDWDRMAVVAMTTMASADDVVTIQEDTFVAGSPVNVVVAGATLRRWSVSTLSNASLDS